MDKQLVILDEKFDGRLFYTIPEPLPFLNKPKAALWSSTYTKGKSAWLDFLKDSGLKDVYYRDYKIYKYLFLPKVEAKLLEVSSYEDLMVLPIKEVKTDIESTLVVDFPKIVEMGYDGFHLTHSGAGLRGPYKNLPDFNFWDVESTCWFNLDCFDAVTEL